MKHLEKSLDGQSKWWKYIIFTVSLAGLATLALIVLLIIYKVLDILTSQDLSMTVDTIKTSAAGMAGNIEFITFMFPYSIMLVITCWLFRWVHRRNYREVINGTRRIRWGRFFFAASLWGLISLAILLINFVSQPDNFSLNFNLLPFLFLVLISLLLVPFQATLEEILFRGYVAQGVASITKSRWWVLIIPSILFAAIHIANPEIAEYGFWAAMPQYLLFALILGLISILDDGIEMAMGLHTINNLYFAVLLTFNASIFETSALLVQKNINPFIDTLLMILAGGIFVLLASKRYGWNYLVMNLKIEPTLSGQTLAVKADIRSA